MTLDEVAKEILESPEWKEEYDRNLDELQRQWPMWREAGQVLAHQRWKVGKLLRA